MIRPPLADSVKTFARVFAETKSIDLAVEAVVTGVFAYTERIAGPKDLRLLGSRRPRGVLEDLPRTLLPSLVIDTVCDSLGIDRDRLLTMDRRMCFVHARQVVGWILVHGAHYPMLEVAGILNMADQAGVGYGCKIFRQKLANDPGLLTEVNGYIERVRSTAVAIVEQRRAA